MKNLENGHAILPEKRQDQQRNETKKIMLQRAQEEKTDHLHRHSVPSWDCKEAKPPLEEPQQKKHDFAQLQHDEVLEKTQKDWGDYSIVRELQLAQLCRLTTLTDENKS